MTAAVLDLAPRSGRCLVTPSGSASFCTSGASELSAKAARHLARQDQPAPFFVDWLTISQEHEEALPVVSSGLVWASDEEGEVEWRTVRAAQFEGSYETHVNVKCDGHKVTFSGNVSRFGRPDNVWGFDFWHCVERINLILEDYGLPPFTAGRRIQLTRRDGDATYRWSGARVSRIDLTGNFEAGGPDEAHAFLAWLGSQHAGRQEGRTLGQGETVSFGGGKGSRQYWKAYIKHLELARHGCSEGELYEHCRTVGLVRFEGTLRTKALTDAGAAWLGDYEKGHAMAELIRIYEDKAQVLGRAERTTDELEHLPRALRATARDYLAGMDCKATMGRRSFYSHRKQLLPYGIDIAVRNVRAFQPRVQVITLRPAVAPSWYRMAA